MSQNNQAMSEHGTDGGAGRDGEFFLYHPRRGRIPRGATHVRVDASVKIIPAQAFHHLKKLRHVELSEGLERIGERAFSGCVRLRRIDVPSTVGAIPRGAFYNCRALEEAELREGLGRIEDGAFEKCVSLRRIAIPSTVKVVSNRALISCGAFHGCGRLEEVELREGLERIGDDAFCGCKALRSVRIPSTVKVISSRAFEGCKRLETVETSEGMMEGIEHSAFCGCKSLKRILVPSTVKVISSRAFKYCVQLTEVDLFDGLQRIEESAFSGCYSLGSVTIPSTVKIIPDKAFLNCNQLEVAKLCEGVEKIMRSSFQGCASLRYISIASTVTAISEGMFSNFRLLEEVKLYEGIQQIEARAFCGCRCLKHIKIPSTVKAIGEYAFQKCVQLAEVELCEGIERIGARAFNECCSLRSIEIPSTVTAIDAAAFMGCELLEVAKLREGLEQMGPSAFEGCKSLKRIGIPSTVSVIPARAFSNCEQLEAAGLGEGLVQLYRSSFCKCKSLKTIKIPSSVTLIGGDAFLDCERLEDVELSEGLETMGHGAFRGCKSLKWASAPASVRCAESRAIGLRKQLDTVDLLEGCGRVEMRSFEGCISLTRVKIPTNVIAIGRTAFYGCRQLMSFEMQHMMIDVLPGCQKLMSLAKMRDFQRCPSLRNLAVSRHQTYLFEGCHDLLKLFGSHQTLHDALKDRFDGLPVHSLCYFQSYNHPDLTMKRLEDILDHSPDQNEAIQDCLGMTPLHILACSTNQNIELFQLLITNYPKSVITEDKWGCLPILYTIWGDSPPEIVRLLISRQKSIFPKFVLDWDHMVETLCRAGASMEVVRVLLGTQQTHFPDNRINWRKTAAELTIRCLVRCDSLEDYFPIWETMLQELQIDAFGAPQGYHELVECLIGIQQRFFPDENSRDLQALCEDFAVSLNGWWTPELHHKSLSTLRFLVKCDILQRLKMIGVRKWRMDIKELVRSIPSVNSAGLLSYFDTIHIRLISFEHELYKLKEVAFLLELALWKSKKEKLPLQCKTMGEVDRIVGHTDGMKEQYRMNCGADIIIPNVLPFLMSK